MQPSVSSIPEIQSYSGQDFGVDGDGLTFRMGQILLLGFNHRNQALKRLRSNPSTRNHPNVVAALERGLQMCRKWTILSRDVADHVAGHANQYHDGAADGPGAILGLLQTRIEPAFEEWKNEKRLKGETFATCGNAAYELFWKWVKPRWGAIFKAKQDLLDCKIATSSKKILLLRLLFIPKYND